MRKTGLLIQMKLILLVTLIVGVGSVSPSWAFQTSTGSTRPTPTPWRPTFGPVNRTAMESPATNGSDLTHSAASPGRNMSPAAEANGKSNADLLQPKNPADQASSTDPGVTRVTKSMDKLPNSAGQIWREYDISPYTSQITNSQNPQKAITEWILRETGTEMWFNEPLGILNASKNELLVYHTPEIHAVVKRIVDRFVRTRGQVQNIDVNLVTVENPNWRSLSYTMLQPINVRSAGVEAWMISKENAAILMSQLSQRGDFKQHSGGRLTNHDGQSFVLEKTQPTQFVRSLRWVPNQVPNYQPLMTSLNEGYRLSITSLSSMNDSAIEAVIKCDVDQIEKLNTVRVNVPAIGGGSQTVNLKVPQLVSWRLHERFRWPNDQVLLLSCGVVASPDPDSEGGFRIPGRSPKSKRADALVFIEYRGPASGPTIGQNRTAQNRLAPLVDQK